jgi:hypothetical protein
VDGSSKHLAQPRHQADMQNVDSFVNLDGLIDFTLFTMEFMTGLEIQLWIKMKVVYVAKLYGFT